MKKAFSLLILLFAAFLCCNAITLQQLEQDIKAANGINPNIVGPIITEYLDEALQQDNFTFISSPQFKLTSKDLTVTAVLNIWKIPVATSLVFTNYSSTDIGLELMFEVNSTIIGGLKGIFDRIAPNQWKKELSELVISGGHIEVLLSTTGKDAGLTLSASIDLSANGIYGEVLVQLIKSYENPLALKFYFPITSSTEHKLGAMIMSHPYGSLGEIHFTYSVPGTYKLAPGIWANQIQITVNIGNQNSFTVNANVIFQAGSQNITFASTGTLQLGQPLVVTGQLTNTWHEPFGLKWITITAATITVTISAQPQITVSGSGPLSFAPSTNVNIGLSIGLQGFVASLTGVPVSDLPDFVEAVSTNKVPPVVGQVGVKGTAGITVASFDDGQYQEGLTLQGSATITSSSSDLLKAQKVLQPSATAGSTVFDFRLFIPIFTPTEPIAFSLTETNNFPIHTGLQCTNFQLNVVLGATDASISIAANFAAKPKNNPTPVTFALSGNWQAGQDVTLSGQLTSQWNDAFGAKWLDITSASATLDVGKAVNALNVEASATCTFNGTQDKVKLSLQSGDNFEQYCFSANLNHLWNVSILVQSMTSADIPFAKDIDATDNIDYGLALCNYAGGSSPNGLTLTASGKIVGALEQHVHYISPGVIPTLIFDTTIYLPIFADPTDYRFYLNVQDPIHIKPDLLFQQFTLILQGGLSGYASLDVHFEANLHNNPAPIYFNMKGVVADSGTVTLTGFETGQWNDIFGIKGFDLSNVDAELAISPSSCVATGCVSDLGVGFTTVIGTKTVKFAGNAAAPDFVDTFIEGSVVAANGSLILTVRDLAIDWNHMVPKHQINVNDVPADMGLKSAFISLAGQSGQFGSYTYQEGFHINAQLDILQILCDVDVSCGISNFAPTCDFNFDVNIDFNAFYNELKKYVHIFLKEKYPGIPDKVIFGSWSLKHVGLSDFKTSLLAQNIYPLWDIQIEVFGHTFNLNFRAALEDIDGTFENFYNKYIKHIF